MVDHVQRRIKFGLMMFLVGSYFVVLIMVIPTCGDYDPMRVLSVDDDQFPA